MQKAPFIPLLFIIACIISGTYGALHNQISYSVSPDYFHQYKFIQFNIDPLLHNRIGASVVGWIASWWMGIIIGLFLISIGYIVTDAKTFFNAVVKSFGIVTFTVFSVGIIALLISLFVVTPDNAGQIYKYDRVINDAVSFRRAGTMHSFSYIGGFMGIISGCIFLRFKCRRVKN